jgi:hypothetical protein
MDQLILFHKPNKKPNKKLKSEMVMDHIIPPTKHPISVVLHTIPSNHMSDKRLAAAIGKPWTVFSIRI